MVFDLPPLEDGETLSSAKLRVGLWQLKALISDELRDRPVLKVSVDRVVSERSNLDGEDGGHTRLVEVDSNLVLSGSGEWCDLDVMDAVQTQASSNDHSTVVHFKLQVTEGPELIDEGNLLEGLLRDSAAKASDLAQKEPILEVAVEHQTDGQDAQERERRSATQQRHTGPCRAYDLTVTLADIGWEKFIVQPRSIPIGYCAGQCDFPPPVPHSRVNPTGESNYSTTHHSLFRTFASTAGLNFGSWAPAPSCAAVRYGRQMTMIYFTLTGVVRTKPYTDLTITDCGCL